MMWRNVVETMRLLEAFLARHETFVFFDTETTGLNPAKDRIVEISAVKLDKGFQEIDSFSSYINPYPVLMTPGASEANGITMEFLADKPKEFEVIPAFAEFCGEAGFLAYNDSFDVSMLGTAHGRLGIEQNIDSFDVLRMARDAMVSENNKLRTVAEALDVVPEDENFHEAMFDVRMTIAVFLKLKEILKEKAEKEAQKNAPQTVLFGGEHLPVGPLRPRIYSISPFSKGKTQRVYISTNIGSIFYDKIRHYWGAGTKSEPLDINLIDMPYVEQSATGILRRHGIESIDKVKEAIKA